MSKVFLIAVAKCNGCYNCQLACKDEHVGNDWKPYAAPQPEIGQFWLKLKEYAEGSIPKVRIHYVAKLCGHCRKPACLNVCDDAAIIRRDDGLVLIEPDKCTGCKKCQEACPYGAIYFNEKESVCQKCTGCAHLTDNNEDIKLPRCVEVCPTGAIVFGEEAEQEDFIVGAETLKPEAGTHPRVYYRNIPGKFIGGTIYDPAEKEVIVGAKVRATIGGKTHHTVTDALGDFWFNDLAVGVFSVVVEAKGFAHKTFARVSTREGSVNLGDIPLDRSP